MKPASNDWKKGVKHPLGRNELSHSFLNDGMHNVYGMAI